MSHLISIELPRNIAEIIRDKLSSAQVAECTESEEDQLLNAIQEALDSDDGQAMNSTVNP